MKKFIFYLIGGALVALGIGYVGNPFIHPQPQAAVASTQMNEADTLNNVLASPRNLAEEKEVIKTLVKSYLYASTNYEWDVISSISTGDYKEKLKTTIIPNFEKVKNSGVTYKFNPNSYDVSIDSIDNKNAVIQVNYVIERGDKDVVLSVQEKVKMYLVKENNKWMIFSVESIK